MNLNFQDAYKTFNLLFCNPDSDDVLSFLYVYEQVQKGTNLNDLQEEIEKNREETGYAYPQQFKQNYRK
jgi:hypothetical protein